jgi:hypothetical protein
MIPRVIVFVSPSGLPIAKTSGLQVISIFCYSFYSFSYSLEFR